MCFEEALYTELSSISELNNNVYPVIANQDSGIPYLTYELSNTERLMDFQGFNGLVTAHYELKIYHSTYSSLKSVSKLITDKIKTFQLRNLATNGPYIQEIEILNQYEGYDEQYQLYFMEIDISATYQEN